MLGNFFSIPNYPDNIDYWCELFKGTNVQDAMKCSTVVIEGLRKMHNALFVLSTHLYEIGQTLKQYDNIQFRYFETEVKNDQLIFSYHLKEGISNDRLGYLILKREGVVDMLNRIPDTSPEVGKSVQSS